MKRKIIALTGKIGSGKSVVASIVRDMGFDTVDCDDLAKQVASNPTVVNRVQQLLGGDSVVQGQLNRKYIREVVFGNKELLEQYQQIFFGGVKALLTANIQSLCSNDTPAEQLKPIFDEIPVLDAFDFHFDEIWRVESSDQACISRVTARDNVSRESVRNTLNSQKCYDCTRVIVNNGNLEQLTQSVHTILGEII